MSFRWMPLQGQEVEDPLAVAAPDHLPLPGLIKVRGLHSPPNPQGNHLHRRSLNNPLNVRRAVCFEGSWVASWVEC